MKKLMSILLTVCMLISMTAVAGAETLDYTYADTIAWDGMYDVVVIGYGSAGANAAIAAADAGANVLMVEKAPKGHEGGNSRICGQYLLTFTDYDMGLNYMKGLRGEFTTTSDAEIEWLTTGLMANEAYLNSLGIENTAVYKSSAEYPELAGGESVRMLMVGAEHVLDNFNSAYWKAIAAEVDERAEQISVWYDAPGKHLIQDPATKTILGVQIEKNGEMLNIRAKNGVVLATGGFENNPEMVQNYLQYNVMYPHGTTYNTGDGVIMAQEVGAQLWHMRTLSGGFLSYRAFEGTTQVPFESMGQNMTAGTSVINVGPDGKRFCDEGTRSRHGFVSYNGMYKNQVCSTPMYTIFDETTRLAGKIYPTFSEGNLAEVESGLIVKADTIAKLAEKIGYDPAVLEATVAEYNTFCENGVDEDFGRAADKMTKIEVGPFYAMELVPAMVNTQGGPRRNINCEVLDLNDNPIPHLYSAGELGSFFSDNYQGGGNLGETVVTGKTAGENAAAEKEALPNLTIPAKVESNLNRAAEVAAANDEAIATAENEYVGVGKGIGGDLTVKVTMDGDKIAAIEVLSHGETAGICEAAIEKVPAAIIEAQSAEVDGVSGATLTSNGIKEAVANALVNVK